MTRYLAGVLTVIAVGVLLVAYGLLGSGASAIGAEPAMHAAPMSQPMAVPMSNVLVPQGPPAAPTAPIGYGPAGYAPQGYVPAGYAPLGYVPAAPVVMQAPDVRPVRTVQQAAADPSPRRVAPRRLERERRRDWKKTALIVGGSTAAGAGLGGIVGGKKGALIGAAIGGGASTIYETTK